MTHIPEIIKTKSYIIGFRFLWLSK